MKDNICHSYIAMLVEKKQERLAKEDISLFIYFLIKS